MLLRTETFEEDGEIRYRDLFGDIINGEEVVTGTVEYGEQPTEPPTPEPTQLDRIETALELNADSQAEILLNQVEQETDNNMIMDTLAEILLNQMEV